MTSGTKAGLNKHTLSWMEDEDLVLSVKEWNKREGESKLIINTCQLTLLIK